MKPNPPSGNRLKMQGPDGQPQFPDFGDLLDRLRISPKDGRIDLGGQRMLLVHSKALSSMRRELTELLGKERARGVLTRMGYIAGDTDARLARQMRSEGEYFDAFIIGPQLHALEGAVQSEPVRFEYDPASRHFYGEFIWRDSSEVEQHLAHYGPGNESICWTQVGYASGFTSAFVGRPILYRELKCRGRGDPYCLVVGKPVEDWAEGQDEMRFLQVQPGADNTNNTVPTAIDYRKGRYASSKANPPVTVLAKSDIVGISSGFTATCHLISRVAPTQATVLLIGESGVGKERFARMLHETSPRANAPFVAINCAAIPEQLMESELFGAERGAYTGATHSLPGYFEQAVGGTLFLDEISTLGFVAQAKLLRVLQEREIQRVGDTKARKVDVRVLAATNENLRNKVKAGLFREDLYYRLNVFPIRIPPLRERREDIPFLMEHFFRKFCTLHRREHAWFSPQAVEGVMNYPWPGNIRELENAIERAVILAEENETIEPEHLFSETDIEIEVPGTVKFSANKALTADSAVDAEQGSLLLLEQSIHDAIKEGGVNFDYIEDLCIKTALEISNRNIAKAARMLGMSRAQLAYRITKKVDSRGQPDSAEP